MDSTPLGTFYSVGTFFPCGVDLCAEDETAVEILRVLRRMPDASSVEDGVARLHWRFTIRVDAQAFWTYAFGKFPALPWNLLHNPSWAAQAAIPDRLPEDL